MVGTGGQRELHHPRPLHRMKDQHQLNSSVSDSKAKGLFAIREASDSGGSGHDLGLVRSSPASGSVLSREPTQESLPLCLHAHTRTRSLCVSL